ncbi:craniofacial development protein 2-like protein [Willisornis vidua]|uniref:Craniofacial development protein 2-like protein n=1 Tax=Willisornis vidua TaxID=1566151 RepID=A0ABQ9E1B9_9PASS|nr:craniofacial development protein 2-like protein [Willisornis vidua]
MCWNIRTMFDTVDSGHSEHRSALLAHKLSQLNINIAALSEVCLHAEGSLKDHGTGYTLYWSGKLKIKSHLSGAGFMINTPSHPNLKICRQVILISLCIPLSNKLHVVLFSICAPTLQADLVEKDKFYTDLHCLTQKVPTDDKIIILGDFNGRVGKNSDTWKGVLGKQGFGNYNDNGCLLLEFCAEQQLTITNNIFQQKDSLTTTWMHP